MAKSLKIMLIAGEASGDILGADLMKALASKYKPATFLGVGGEYMQKAGLESLFEMSELSVMGLVEVLPYLPRLKKRVDLVRRRRAVHSLEAQRNSGLVAPQALLLHGRALARVLVRPIGGHAADDGVRDSRGSRLGSVALLGS